MASGHTSKSHFSTQQTLKFRGKNKLGGGTSRDQLAVAIHTAAHNHFV